ncbi:MAG TPA: TetR/AcrR family transcriptional regulator [Spirochaetota bacterium]|nr:TetR/AcrR family transcriptional regulator [Spirochaetota bacterium]HPS86204.1 TetR/AcrR family transcriptional regulator [Spirochaetota bacterium]
MSKKKSDIARAEIIDAARKVLSQIGVNNMTLQAVADAASISKGALYYYYKSKDEILYDIMAQDNAHSREIAGKLIEKDYDLDVESLKREVAKGVLNRFTQLDKNKLNLYLQGEALQGNIELQKRYNDKYHEWINNIDGILSRIYGVESTDITRTFSTIALAAIEGICIQKALMDNVEGDEDLIGKIIMFLLNLNYHNTEKILKKNPDLSYK